MTLRRLYIETMQAIVAKTPTTVLGNGGQQPLPLLNVGGAAAGLAASPTTPKAAP